MNHPPLLLLHGALETSAQFDQLAAQLSDSFDVHRFTFLGHGPETAGSELSIDEMAQQTLDYLNDHKIDQVSIFGYSMGGYVALLLSKSHPHRINRIATLGTILRWTPEKAAEEGKLLDPNTISEKVPRFAQHLKKLHGEQWPSMVQATRTMLESLGNQPPLIDSHWPELNLPIRLHVGDRDRSAGLSDTLTIYKQLPNAELSVLPDTAHPFPKVDLDLLIPSLNTFFRLH
ncbi:MAG: alpha/beta fold hydrolase [Bacteroidota bacterium]